MDPEGRATRPIPPEEGRPLGEAVPARAVLTELARGFLLTQPWDPDSAKRFAISFLREQAGRSPPARLVSIQRQPTVRRGVESATDRSSGRSL
jgi:alkanesulfonate monooxygenase SsuD/methylene tetrahydromethanopterin reductase-like flavin-dependent oxidoreductase (luciferase family)